MDGIRFRDAFSEVEALLHGITDDFGEKHGFSSGLFEVVGDEKQEENEDV
jgi:hypothetical protein